jgi:hypothetical protein
VLQQLQARVDQGAGFGAFFNVTPTSSFVVKSTFTGGPTDGDPTTEQIGGTGTFFSQAQDGGSGSVMDDNANPSAFGEVGAARFTETEWCIQFVSADLADGDIVEFRFTNDSGATLSYTVTPSVTISAADTGREVTDGAEFTDSVPVGVGVLVSEGSDFGDTSAARADLSDALTEGAEFGDDADLTIRVPLTEGAVFGDALTQRHDFDPALTEGADFGEDFTTTWRQTFPAEGTAFGDELAAPVRVTVTEGADFGDGVASELGVLVTEGADFGDTLGRDHAGTLSDGADFGDSPATALATTISEGAEFSDVSDYEDPARDVTEGAAFGDASSPRSDFAQTVTEGAEFSDSSSFGDATREVTEGTEFGDSLAAQTDYSVSASEGTDFGDSSALGIAVTTSDGAAFGDAPSPLAGFVQALSEGSDFGDDSTYADDLVEITEGAVFGEDFTTRWRQSFPAEGAVFGDRASDSQAIVDGAKFGEDFTVTLTEDTGPDGAKFGDVAHVSGQSLGVADGSVFGDTSSRLHTTYRTVTEGSVFGDASDGSTVQDSSRGLTDGTSFGDTSAAVTGLIWDETFEPVGYHEAWSQGENVAGAATIDEDAAVPANAPPWWGDKSMRVVAPGGNDTADVGHVTGFATDPTWVTFGFYIRSEDIGFFDGSRIIAQFQKSGVGGISTVRLVRDLGSGTPLQLINDVTGESSDPRVAIRADRYYLSEFRWDQGAGVWEWWVNDVLIGSDAIGAPATDGREIDTAHIGIRSASSGSTSLDIDFGRFTLSEARVTYPGAQADEGAEFGDARATSWVTKAELTEGSVFGDEPQTHLATALPESAAFGDALATSWVTHSAETEGTVFGDRSGTVESAEVSEGAVFADQMAALWRTKPSLSGGTVFADAVAGDATSTIVEGTLFGESTLFRGLLTPLRASTGPALAEPMVGPAFNEPMVGTAHTETIIGPSET